MFLGSFKTGKMMSIENLAKSRADWYECYKAGQNTEEKYRLAYGRMIRKIGLELESTDSPLFFKPPRNFTECIFRYLYLPRHYYLMYKLVIDADVFDKFINTSEHNQAMCEKFFIAGVISNSYQEIVD
jgi:hypothetical protein